MNELLNDIDNYFIPILYKLQQKGICYNEEQITSIFNEIDNKYWVIVLKTSIPYSKKLNILQDYFSRFLITLKSFNGIYKNETLIGVKFNVVSDYTGKEFEIKRSING